MKIALIASLFVILSFESCNQGSNRFSKGLNDNDTISLIAQNTAQVSHAKVNPINLTTPNGDSIGIQKLLSKKNKIFSLSQNIAAKSVCIRNLSDLIN
jgi:hypothetical protein